MSLRTLLNRLLGRQPNNLPPFNFARNRFPAKRQWPPNMHQLTHKQQFRFERKFKRRIKQKAIRPTLNKWVTIVQWSLISFVVVYSVFFYDFRNDPYNPQPGEQPFEEFREWFFGKFRNFWTHTEKTLKPERGARRVESSPHGGVAGKEDDDQSPQNRS